MSLVFKQRYVVFLDVLGFKDMLSKSNFQEKASECFDKIEVAIMKATQSKTDHGIYPNEEITFSVMSDSIVLSIPFPENTAWTEKMKTLRFLLSSVEKIQFSLALDGIWLRGSVSEGELSHDSKNVIGKGLVKAYLLEQESVYPRVLVDAEIFKSINNPLLDAKDKVIKAINDSYGNPQYSGKFVFDWKNAQAINKFQQDYPFFINYFNPLLDEDKSQDRDKVINLLKPQLFTHNPSVYEKYRWIIDYLRSMVKNEINRRESIEPNVDVLTGKQESDASFLKRKDKKYLEDFFNTLSTM